MPRIGVSLVDAPGYICLTVGLSHLLTGEGKMIQGLFVVEDRVISWNVMDGETIRYSVQDSLSGLTATVQCSAQIFGLAMAVCIGDWEALPFDEMDMVAETVAEIMPKYKHVLGYTEAPADKHLTDMYVPGLRWIP
jgi:iron uptake system EfeUOB component EfeO/EfeM